MSNFPTVRLRRTRQNEKLRSLVRETHLAVEQLIYPLFIAEGLTEPREVPSMPGIMQWSLERVGREAERIAYLGIPAVLLFGLPNEKDEVGSQAYAAQGIIQRTIRHLKAEVPDLLIQRGFAASGRELGARKLEALFGDFLAHYNAHIAELTRLYPGVEAALERFAARWTNMVSASCPSWPTQQSMLRAFMDHFAKPLAQRRSLATAVLTRWTPPMYVRLYER